MVGVGVLKRRGKLTLFQMTPVYGLKEIVLLYFLSIKSLEGVLLK